MNNYWSINPWLPDTDLIDLDMHRKAAKGCALNLTQENECIFCVPYISHSKPSFNCAQVNSLPKSPEKKMAVYQNLENFLKLK